MHLPRFCIGNTSLQKFTINTFDECYTYTYYLIKKCCYLIKFIALIKWNSYEKSLKSHSTMHMMPSNIKNDMFLSNTLMRL